MKPLQGFSQLLNLTISGQLVANIPFSSNVRHVQYANSLMHTYIYNLSCNSKWRYQASRQNNCFSVPFYREGKLGRAEVAGAASKVLQVLPSCLLCLQFWKDWVKERRVQYEHTAEWSSPSQFFQILDCSSTNIYENKNITSHYWTLWTPRPFSMGVRSLWLNPSFLYKSQR